MRICLEKYYNAKLPQPFWWKDKGNKYFYWSRVFATQRWDSCTRRDMVLKGMQENYSSLFQFCLPFFFFSSHCPNLTWSPQLNYIRAGASHQGLVFLSTEQGKWGQKMCLRSWVGKGVSNRKKSALVIKKCTLKFSSS